MSVDNYINTLTLPKYTLGIDIETKDVTPNAYILAIAGVMFNNYTLKIENTWRLDFKPDDPEQAHRSESKNTIDWWNTRKDSDAFPSQNAYDLTWNGTTGYRANMELFVKFMTELPRGNQVVIPMRGPDFDYVILRDAIQDLGLNYRMPARNLDSHRTVERIMHCLELPPITEQECKRWWRGAVHLPHVAVYDAAMEGYETARMYYILHMIKKIGYNEAMELVKAWSVTDEPVANEAIDLGIDPAIKETKNEEV